MKAEKYIITYVVVYHVKYCLEYVMYLFVFLVFVTAVDAFSVDVIDSYGAPKQATKTDTQMQADSLRAPETSLMACKSMKFRASDEQTKIEHSGEPDSQRTDTWYC